MAEKAKDEAVVESEVTTLFPVSSTVTIDGQEYTVNQFKLGKTLLMLETVSELLEKTDLAALITGGTADRIVETLASELPNIIKYGRPILLRAMALTLTPDKEVAALDSDGSDIRVEMERRGKALSSDLDIEQAVDVVALGIRAMGIETIRKNLPKLAAAVGLQAQPTNSEQ